MEIIKIKPPIEAAELFIKSIFENKGNPEAISDELNQKLVNFIEEEEPRMDEYPIFIDELEEYSIQGNEIELLYHGGFERTDDDLAFIAFYINKEGLIYKMIVEEA